MAMGYLCSLPGNEDRRLQQAQPGPDHVVTPEPVRVHASRRGPDPAVAVALTVLVAVGALIVKPWAASGELGPHPPEGSRASAGQPTSDLSTGGARTESGTPVSTAPVDAAPALLPGRGQGDRPTESPPPGALIENLDPIDPTTWSRISASLRKGDRDGVVFVARWPGGLYWRFVPVEPGERDSPTVTLESADRAGAGTTIPPDTVRMTGYLATPVAIGFTRPADASVPTALAWQILGPGAEFRVPLRHPVGDLDRYLWLGPGLGLPRGEQRNRREISRWPPMWLPGVYRFDLTADGATRHVFVVLEPEGTG